MIISHAHKLIFLKTSKVAGTSFELALANYCGDEDVITENAPKDEVTRAELGIRPAQNHYKNPAQYGLHDIFQLIRNFERPKIQSHATAKEVRALVPEAVWSNYLKVSIVRDPFSYAVSRYFWVMRREANKKKYKSFRDYILAQPDALTKNRRITHIDNQCCIDLMLRYETLADDLLDLTKHTKIPAAIKDNFLSLTAKKGFRPQGATRDSMFADFPEGVDLICSLFEEDIRLYNYSIPST